MGALAGPPSDCHQPGVPSFKFLLQAPAAAPPAQTASLTEVRLSCVHSASLTLGLSSLPMLVPPQSPWLQDLAITVPSRLPAEVEKAVGMVSGSLPQLSRAGLSSAPCSPASQQRACGSRQGSCLVLLDAAATSCLPFWRASK